MPKKTQEALQKILEENVELYEAVELSGFEEELRRGGAKRIRCVIGGRRQLVAVL